MAGVDGPDVALVNPARSGLWLGLGRNESNHGFRSSVPDPMTNNYRYKLGRGVVTKVGESPYKHEFVRMSLKPRNVV